MCVEAAPTRAGNYDAKRPKADFHSDLNLVREVQKQRNDAKAPASISRSAAARVTHQLGHVDEEDSPSSWLLSPGLFHERAVREKLKKARVVTVEENNASASVGKLSGGPRRVSALREVSKGRSNATVDKNAHFLAPTKSFKLKSPPAAEARARSKPATRKVAFGSVVTEVLQPPPAEHRRVTAGSGRRASGPSARTTPLRSSSHRRRRQCGCRCHRGPSQRRKAPSAAPRAAKRRGPRWLERHSRAPRLSRAPRRARR